MFNIFLKLKSISHGRAIDKTSHRVSKSPGKDSMTFSIIGFILKLLLLSFFAGLILFPFYYMMATSLMKKSEVLDILKPSLVPEEPQWSNFATVIKQGFSYWKSLGITLLISMVSVILKVIITMSMGYAFSIKKWRFKKLIWTIMIATIMLPEIALMSGQYTMMFKFGWTSGANVIFALFVPFVASVFSGFMFKNAFEAIPDRIKEAALVDGLNNFTFFIKVGAPMVSPTTWTVCILTALASWNSFMWPSLLLSNTNIQVITTWLFETGFQADPQDTRILINIRLAGAILVMIPTFTFYFILRTRIMKAISKQGSSIKG